MGKFNIIKENRNIIISYDILDQEHDIHIVTNISKVCMKNHLNFLIGEDSFHHRFCNIYGYGESLQRCYNELQTLISFVKLRLEKEFS